jgi:hypothetical protein
MIIRSVFLTSLCALLMGCLSPPPVIFVPLDPQIQAELATLEARRNLLAELKDKIYVMYDEDDCPIGIFEPIDECPVAFGSPNAVCRGEPSNPMGVSSQAKFHTSNANLKFGLRFDFHPCSQPASTLDNLAPNHTCTITPKTPTITEILKYTIIGPESCPEDRRELDPYFIVVR